MISNEEKEGWRYLAVKKILAFLHRITSNNNGDSYSFITKNKLKSHKKACKKRKKNFGPSNCSQTYSIADMPIAGNRS